MEFQRLRDTICHFFTPAVVGREILEKEHDLLELPARFGGLAFADPVKTASQAFAVSQEATRLLKDAVFTGADIDMADHMAHCQRTVTAEAKEREMFTRRSSQLIASLSPLAHRTLSRIVKGNASGWLTVLPLRQEGYDLTSTQFRDQLAIRYGHEPSHLPSHFDGCGASFTLQHALDCPKGGLIKRGHNDNRDHDAKLADLAWGGVTVEPVLGPADDCNSRPALQADWSARGVWEGNRVALFDNRIVDAKAPSYQ